MSTALVAGRPRSAAERAWRFARTPKVLLLPILLILVAVTAPGSAGGAGRAWLAVATATATAAVVDVICAAVRWRTVRVPDGALGTGLILGMILDPTLRLTTVAVVAALAIVGKRLIRTRRGHLFNPAALVLVAAAPFGVKAQSWWGVAAAPGYVVLPLIIVTGLFIADRVNRLPMVGAFLGTYYAVLGLAAFTGFASRVVEAYHAPFLDAALFAALVMLTDPPTSPGRRTEQYTYGVVTAVVSVVCVITVHQLYFLPLGLLTGNLWLAALRIRQRAAAGRRPSRPSE